MPDRYENGHDGLHGLRTTDPDRVAHDLFDWSQRLVGIDGAVLFTLRNGRLDPSHAYEIPVAGMAQLSLDADAEGPVQDALKSGSTQVHTGKAELCPGQLLPWSTTLCIPLIIDESPVGVYAVGWVAPFEVGRDAILVLEGAAAMAGSAIYAARLLHDVKREQRRMFLVVDRLPLAALQFSEPDFVVHHLNARARSLFEQIEDMSVADLLESARVETMDGTPITAESAGHMLQAGEGLHRFRLMTGDGTLRTFQSHITRFGSGGGVIILADVTLEANLERQRQRFVRMVSHHLRTPLTPLVGYVELLKSSGGVVSDYEAVATDIGAAADQILTQVSRLEQIVNLQPVEPETMDLVPVRDLVMGACRQNEVDLASIVVDVDPALEVHCAELQVRTAIVEVLDNAFRHGQPPITVTGEASGGFVEISFRDSGPGIPEDWESAVFAPYLDARSGYVAPEDGGVGLGLTLARGLTEASYGELTYEDGSFVFRLRTSLPGAGA